MKKLISILTFAALTGIFVFSVSFDQHKTSAQTNPNTNAAPPKPAVVDDFVPEFRYLPSFDSIWEDKARSKATFVDVRGVGNNYYPDEVIAKTGETWFGLFRQKELLTIRKTTVSVKKEDRPNYSLENSVTLRFSQKDEPVFLIKDAGNITEGDIITLESWNDPASDNSPAAELVQGFRRTYIFNGVEYILRVTTGLQTGGEKVNVLVLESGDRSQIVSFNHYYKDHNTLYNSIGELLWVGDMDNDGRLDLYYSEFGFEKGGFGSGIYLSSLADKGKLVKLAAAFGSSGC